ncbi:MULTISPECIES: type II toxin-antitoxin system RelE/ParE family toxin [Tenebrionibacter/Tenebrionicola group]|jgi:toxin ParE1/3/4|uniref:Type II toxin-antitoxin system RelE/ParE family toxin n=2 Tax=Tenebrionibacter/Tenebrionicola group TaxID=2969848 RepID=A0A8K0V8A5_9ENTR|nr:MULTISPECIES: type II toxin-antitoxin system RelE/ParE family toxin [Tenebrionibacter/Tenebrionicola group]MBK4717193.1 type II toxin-antitoxin system RelE/ParE family toxin [Tenebrionibacter intestinalis]MBV5097662.1 type II toxin-antitoxin system RelE/ParE family toxin [Tenebrionicola larvae]
MKAYPVIFAPEAEEQLLALYRYIREAASAATAQAYTEGLIDYCESLGLFPERGNQRDDLLAGLRVTNWRKRTVIAFVVEDEQVKILGIWHGGQQYESGFTGE